MAKSTEDAIIIVEFRVVWWRWCLLRIYWTFLECLLETLALFGPFIAEEALNRLCALLRWCWDDARRQIQPLWCRYNDGEWQPLELYD